MYRKWLYVALVFFISIVPAKAQHADTTQISLLIVAAQHLEHSQPDSAVILFREALRKSEQASFSNGVVSTLSYLSGIYTRKGWDDSSIVLLQNTFTVCSKSNKLQSISPVVCNKLGILYQGQGKYEIAMQCYLKAIGLAEKYGVIDYMASIYNNIGSLLINLKRKDEALPYLNKAEEIAGRTQNYETLAYALMNKAIVYRDLEKWEESQLYFEKAIGVSRRYKMLQVLYLTLSDFGSMYIIRGMPEKALPYLLETQSLQGDISPYNQSEALRNLGGAYALLHDYKKAAVYLQRAIIIADKHRLFKGSLMAHKWLSEANAETGNYQQAYSNVMTYMAMNDSIENLNVAQNLNQLEVKFRTSEKDKELIQKQLQIARQESSIRRKDMWLIGISAGTLLLLALLGLLFALYKSNQHKQSFQDQKIKALQHQHEIGHLKAIMKGEEQERSRIARELHDGIGGMLASINMRLDVAMEDHPEITGQIEDVVYMLRDTSAEVRKTAHNLMPDILTHHRLQDALTIYCQNINANNRLQIDLQFNGALETLDKAIELILYRIVQELLQNIVKHSNATTADVLLSLYDDKLTLSVDDNGIGFDVNKHTNGYGLQNLKYRVQALQGQISIMSGNGTTVYIEFNLEKLEDKITT